MDSDDFSTNIHFATKISAEPPARHPEFCFDDGNIAVLTGGYYFLVHEGLLCRHSEVLAKLTKGLDHTKAIIEGRNVLQLEDSPEGMANFLQALYDGISSLPWDGMKFSAVSELLRLLTKYQVRHLRTEVLRGLCSAWPSTLALWDLRETKATNSAGLYSPRETLPHPILVIKLARDINALEILPSAFYDLSRYPPSHATAGYIDPETDELHQLPRDDLLNLLRGREHASRFLSTFIVNELEARTTSEWCINRNEEELARRRACQVAFEAITFELLSDVGGVFCKRSSDPLYAIVDSELMQTRYDIPGTENKNGFRACEACRGEFGAVVDAAREEFWGKLPIWFGVEVENWS